MILQKNIEVFATGKLLTHLKKIGYILKSHEKITIPVSDLPKVSMKKVRVKCDICNSEKEIPYGRYLQSFNNGNYYSCIKCKNKLKKTIKEKYNVENISQLESIKKKKKETLISNYGSDNLLEINSGKIKKKYGVDNVFQSEIIKKKITETIQKKYGVDNPQQNSDIKTKTEQTNIKKYGFRKPLQNDKIKQKLKETQKKKIKEKYKRLNIISIDDNFEICVKCDKNHIYKTRTSLIYDRVRLNNIECTICNPVNSYSTSGKEIQLINFIKENYSDTTILNNRNIISPYELDIYLPDLNLAFEFNGIYWHNELNKHKDYHKMKSDLCKERGIQLMHIWEDDWNYKQNIVKSMILNKVSKTNNKIFARKTKINKISDNNLVRNFLNENHLQGFVGSTTKIGLFYEDELVSLMLFTNRKNEIELVRFCSKSNTTIVGGASKLLKYYINNYSDKIHTFSDVMYSNGELYENIGFVKEYDLRPDYYYVVDGKRKHKFNFRGKNEKIRMLENKIYKIYDAGKVKYKYKNI